MDTGPVNNFILLADPYKVCHYRQYPPETTNIYAYFESRGGRFPYTVFFGLQYILKRWFLGKVITEEVISEAKEVIDATLEANDVFNEEGWKYILKKHGGFLPLRIKAVAEGTVVPVKNVLFTVENTDPKVPWLTTYVETILVHCWYPMTVATNSRIQKQIIHHYNELTSDDKEIVGISLHDAGYRGVSSVESAAIGGAAHMVNFKGSDTIAGTCLLRKYYHVESVTAHSGVATEHSCIISWGRDQEKEAIKNMMTVFPGKFIGIVIDSYDVWNCLEETIGKDLKEQITEFVKGGGKLELRPDSGDPTEVVLRCLEILGKAFGTEKNSKGYKCLPEYIKLFQADGVDYKRLASILRAITEKGWSSCNATFGSGAALIQKLDRDTQKCAYKCSSLVVNGKEIEINKEPVTDKGKKSKKGRLALHRNKGKYETVKLAVSTPEQDMLETVYEDGKLLKDFKFEEVCQNAELTSTDLDEYNIIKFIEDESKDITG